jgi:hypothetical protein
MSNKEELDSVTIVFNLLSTLTDLGLEYRLNKFNTWVTVKAEVRSFIRSH